MKELGECNRWTPVVGEDSMPRRSSWINVGFRWWQHPWRKDVTFEPQIPKPLRKLRKIRSDHVIPVWVSSLDRLPERTILTEIAPAAILEVATADLSLNHRSESAAKLRVRARRRCLASMDRRITFFRGTSNSHRLGPVAHGRSKVHPITWNCVGALDWSNRRSARP